MMEEIEMSYNKQIKKSEHKIQAQHNLRGNSKTDISRIIH